MIIFKEVYKVTHLDVGDEDVVVVAVLEEELHPLEGVHGLDEADVLLVLDVGVEDELLPVVERLDPRYARLHLLPAGR